MQRASIICYYQGALRSFMCLSVFIQFSSRNGVKDSLQSYLLPFLGTALKPSYNLFVLLEEVALFGVCLG